MRVGALVSNRELGKGLVIENTGAGWLVYWYERSDTTYATKLFKTVICKTNTFPSHWACGGGFGIVSVLSLGGRLG